MKNKIHNINILIILLLSIFIIIPKDVNAEDAAKCNENFANFWCKYEVPEVKGSGAIYISDALEAPFVVDLNTGVGSDYAVHGAMTFKYHICSDGKGAVTGFAYWSGAGGFNVDAKSFIEDVNYFYDKTTKLGKCPNAFVMIQNGTALDWDDPKIKVRKTADNAECSAASACTRFEIKPQKYNDNGKPWYGSDFTYVQENYTDCKAILGTADYTLGWLIKKALFYIKIAAPILVLILSTIDFVKAVIINDDDTMKKAQKKLIIRLIVAILLFLVPTILELLLDIFGFTASNCQL